jgi:hypothetical protein
MAELELDGDHSNLSGHLEHALSTIIIIATVLKLMSERIHVENIELSIICDLQSWHLFVTNVLHLGI